MANREVRVGPPDHGRPNVRDEGNNAAKFGDVGSTFNELAINRMQLASTCNVYSRKDVVVGSPSSPIVFWWYARNAWNAGMWYSPLSLKNPFTDLSQMNIRSAPFA
jgi:hypothetical protein